MAESKQLDIQVTFTLGLRFWRFRRLFRTFRVSTRGISNCFRVVSTPTDASRSEVGGSSTLASLLARRDEARRPSALAFATITAGTQKDRRCGSQSVACLGSSSDESVNER